MLLTFWECNMTKWKIGIVSKIEYTVLLQPSMKLAYSIIQKQEWIGKCDSRLNQEGKLIYVPDFYYQ
jgi:hypothetical protein